MDIKRILIAFIVLVLVITGVLLIVQKNKNNKQTLALPTQTPSVTQQIIKQFPGLTIPSDAEKIELKNVFGGEGMGIATRNEVLADLPALPPGQSYQVLLSNGTKTVLLGNMKVSKGGYILDYNSKAYPGYNQIIVVKGTTHILEGSF